MNAEMRRAAIDLCEGNIIKLKGTIATFEAINPELDILSKLRSELVIQEAGFAALTAKPVKAPEFAVHANQPCWPSITVGMRDSEWKQALRAQGYQVEGE